MSRFNSKAYDKLFPRVKDPDPVPETAVETFRPSQEEVEEKTETVLPELDNLPDDPIIPEEGGTDENGEPGEPDHE